MESVVHAAVPLRVGKKMRKRRELDALVGGGGGRGGRLLSASSDEGEPWARRSSRRRRSRPFVRLAAALGLCVCVVSAATVLWLFVDVRQQIVSLRIEMDRVTTSSNGVNDELQLCHTTAKELRVNVSKLGARLAELEEQHLELVKKVEKATGELATVSDQLSAAPKLADTPRRLLELQQTVGTFGSQISGFDSELKSAHQLASTATAGVKEVKTSLLELEARTNGTIANVTKVQQRDEELSTQLVAVNSTLGARVDALQSRIDDATRPASTPLPTTSTSTTTTTVAPPQSPSSAPSTTTMTPGSPEKPKLLKS